MKDSRSKKAIAASLSLTLALGSVPAVALADESGQDSSKDIATQSATDSSENLVRVSVTFVDENNDALPATATSGLTERVVDGSYGNIWEKSRCHLAIRLLL